MKKLFTIILTFSFILTTFGGAYANTTTTTDTTQPPAPITDSNNTNNTVVTPDPITITTSPISTPPAIVVETKAYSGNVKEIDLINKSVTITHANKKKSKVFTFNEQTTFKYKGKSINPDKIGKGSRLVVSYQILSDKSEKVIKVQVVKLSIVKKIKTNKPSKKLFKVKRK